MRHWVSGVGGSALAVVLGLSCACERGSDPPPSENENSGGSPAQGTGGSAAGGLASATGGAAGRAPDWDPPLQACADAVALGSEPLIDDFEDADDVTLTQDGRAGGSYAYDDGTQGEQSFSFDEIVGGRGDSTHALHTSGSGWSDWGAGFAIVPRADSVDADGNELSCWYDASTYEGVRFWARGNSVPVRVKVTMADVIPFSEGGSCDPAKALCYDDHGVDLTFNDDWQEFTVPFSSLKQAGWGTNFGAFDAHRIRKLQFATLEDVVFDYWVDDIGFYPQR